jgi:hypothetical protein
LWFLNLLVKTHNTSFFSITARVKIVLFTSENHGDLDSDKMGNFDTVIENTPLDQSMLQICKQVVARLLPSRYQDVFALLVPSCCDKSGTSCYHLVTRLMTVTDLLQVVPTRLIQAVRNKLLRACCHQPVNNLLRADDIRLVGTTCCESVGIVNLVTR